MKNEFILNKHNNQVAWIIGWIVLITLIICTESAYAITLVKSDPAGGTGGRRSIVSTPPAQIQLWFSENVNQANISLSVYAEDGSLVTDATPQVTANDPTSIIVPLPALTAGLYTVEYYVTSTSGQSINSEYTFRVKEEENSSPVISTQTLIDTETLLNWAENTYAEFFPDHQITQNIEPWLFRHYPQTNIYAGVNTNDNNVYVLGGPWGNNPAFIDTLSNLSALIANSNNNNNGNGNNSNNRTPTCDTTNAPAGLLYTQNSTIVNVTTNGECIPLPENTNLCPIPQQTSATGISLITFYTATSSVIKGVENPFYPAMSASAFTPTREILEAQYCTINAPEETVSLIVNADFCYDMTAEINESTLPIMRGTTTINPPVTFATKGVFKTVVSQRDCFASGATIITDAATGEMWKRQEDDSYIKVSN
ncbi:MAG: copper resistance protein CopC [Nitrosomonas sp.]|nr:copper resistance protein CopC [Nitrosomonas sp.]